jgi:hypothetical protein
MHNDGKIKDVHQYSEDITAFAIANNEYLQAREDYCKAAGIDPKDQQKLKKPPTLDNTYLYNEMIMCRMHMNDLAEKQYEVSL